MKTILILGVLAAFASGVGCGFDFQGSFAMQPHAVACPTAVEVPTCQPTYQPVCQPEISYVPEPCPPPVVVVGCAPCPRPVVVRCAPPVAFRCPSPIAVRTYHRK